MTDEIKALSKMMEKIFPSFGFAPREDGGFYVNVILRSPFTGKIVQETDISLLRMPDDTWVASGPIKGRGDDPKSALLDYLKTARHNAAMDVIRARAIEDAYYSLNME